MTLGTYEEYFSKVERIISTFGKYWECLKILIELQVKKYNGKQK